MSLWFYTDAALTEPLLTNLITKHFTNGAEPDSYKQRQLWIGDPDAGYKYEVESDPGNANIEISIEDSDAGGGNGVTAVKLSLTQVGLGAAVGGDPLSLGTTLLSGVGNAVEFWLEADDTTAIVQTLTDLSFKTQSLIQTAA